jgi:hypothetical protein
MRFVPKFQLGILLHVKYLGPPVQGNWLRLVTSLLYVKLRLKLFSGEIVVTPNCHDSCHWLAGHVNTSRSCHKS